MSLYRTDNYANCFGTAIEFYEKSMKVSHDDHDNELMKHCDCCYVITILIIMTIIITIIMYIYTDEGDIVWYE